MHRHAAVLALLAANALAQNPPGGKEPILRLEAGGPTSFVNALAMTEDGSRIYAAGNDQVVRSWSRTPGGEWKLDPFAFRVPIGPGLRGAINAVAVSADGTWLAAAGNGVTDAGVRQVGFIVPAVGLAPERYRDIGVIHVWNTRDRTGRVLRGHTGSVLALAFGPPREGKPPLLASAAADYNLTTTAVAGGLRLWDPAAEVPEVAARELPPLPNTLASPTAGLAVWPTGAEAKQAQVIVGWGDGVFRRWDVAADRLDRWDDPGPYTPLTVFPDRPKWLTVSYAGGQAQLRVWERTATPPTAPAARPAFTAGAIPQTVALLSSKGDGKPDYLAAVLEGERRDGRYPYILELVSLDDGEVKRTVELWRGRRNLPRLATAMSGKHLTVAGNDDHELHVFTVEQLIKGQGEPQKLRSVGAVFRSVTFAKNGDAVGLVLGASPKADRTQVRDGDLVFDLTKRSLSKDTAGWAATGPNVTGWGVRVSEDKRSVTTQENGADRATVTLRTFQVVTDAAVLPPGLIHKRPILAIASETRGAPFLALYDAATGEQFRLYTGHTDPIRAIAFSPDGRLLASVAEDQTVIVWSLTNLDPVLGTRGLLRGLPVKEDAGRLVLAPPDRERALEANLAKLKAAGVESGAELEGLVENGAVRKLARTAAFYEAVSHSKPGSTATLRFAGKGDVALTVGQAIDERQPLFTLFVTRDGRAEPRDWIGWSPFGPYDSGDRKAERWIGWHFNPTKSDAAATFDSPADQYHKEFHREGILRHLVAQGAIGPALREWDRDDMRKPLPKPVMKPWIGEAGPNPEKAGGAAVVRVAPKMLKLLVGNFPADRIAKLEWQINDGPRRPFAAGDGIERSADVSNETWKRGASTVRVFLTTKAEEPREYSEVLPLRVQPPPPGLPNLPENERRRVMDRPAFPLSLAVRPSEGHPAKVTFRQFADGQEVPDATDPKEVTLNAAGEVTPSFKLKPGLNRIEVTAVNADAPAAEAEYESARVVLLAEFQPRPAPRIRLGSVVPASGEAVSVPDEMRVAVSGANVQLSGSVTSADDLTELRWQLGEGEPRRMSAFAEGKKEIAFDQRLVLQPGSNMVRVLAKSAGEVESIARLVIEYRPEPPRAEIVLPARGQLFYEGTSERKTEVRARLIPAEDQTPFQVALLVNGREVPAPKVEGQELIGSVPLADGPNRIELRVRNEWGAEHAAEPVDVRYLRPPVAQGANAPERTDRSLINLEATVRSATPLDKDSVEIQVNRRPVAAAVTLTAPNAGDAWSVKITDVPLDGGDNVVRMWVRNGDARSRQPAEWKVNYAPRAQSPPPPEVEFVEPSGDVRVLEQKLKVRFRVRSGQPITKVELRRDGGNPLRVPLDPAAGPEFTTEVDLIPGPNPLKAVAVNAGGQGEATLVASYLPEPVELVIEKIVPRGQEDAPLVPRVADDGRLVLDRPSAGPRVLLYGKVYWSQPDDPQIKAVTGVNVYVNGFQQRTADLLPFRDPGAGKRPERRFVAEVTLNRATANRVEIVLPGLKQRSANRREFAVDCSAPEPVRRLHLCPVVIRKRGDAPVDDKALVARLSGLIPSLANAEVRTYPPLTRFVNQGQLLNRLAEIKATQDLTAGDGSTGDLIVLYYQGGEALTESGHYLLTSASEFDPDLGGSALSVDALADLLGQTLGAQVVLFDLARRPVPTGTTPPPDRITQWPDQPNVCVFRYSSDHSFVARLLDDLTSAMGQAGTLTEAGDQLQGRLTWDSTTQSWTRPDSKDTRADWRIPNNLGFLPVKLGK